MRQPKKSTRLFFQKCAWLTLGLALLSPLMNPVSIDAKSYGIGNAIPILFKEAHFLSTSALYKAFYPNNELEETTTLPSSASLVFPSGIWSAEIEGNEICFRFDHSDRRRNSHWMQSECFPRSAFGQLPMGQEGTFTLVREAGTVEFKGKFEGNEGLGRHSFKADQKFTQYLSGQGYSDIKEETIFSLFLLDFSRDYMEYLKGIDMKPEGSSQLRKIAYHGLPFNEMKQTMSAFAQLGYDNISLKEFVEIQIHDVTPDYVRAMAKAGFTDLTIKELKQASIHDVDPAYVKDLNSAGFKNLSLNEVVQMAIHDVDAQFVKELNQMGYKDLTPKEVKNAAIHDVSAAYVRDLKSAGFDNLTLQEVVQLAIHDVDSRFVKELNSMGFKNMSIHEVRNAAIHDVSASYARELKSAGFDDLSLKEIIQFAIHDVDARFVKDLADMGYKNVSSSEIRNAAIHNVSSRYIKSLNQLGFKEIPLRQVINLKIHDVTPEFIKLAQSKGLTGLSLDEYRNLKIHGLDEKLRRTREE